MANRIPLIVDTTDSNKIKELPIGDNLLMTGSNIVGVSGITAQSITTTTGTFTNLATQNFTVTAATNLGNITNITITGGTAGQSLITDGTGNVSFSNVGNYNQALNTTDNVQFNFINARRLEAPINVNAEIRTSSTSGGTQQFIFTSTGNLQLPGILLGNVTGNVTGNLIGNLTGNTTGVHTGAVTGNVTGNLTGNVTGNTAGTHTGAVTGNVTGSVTGNVTGNTTGTHTGAVVGNVTGNVTGSVTGAVNGNVTGNLTGNVDGDLEGSVFADDSTQMINGVTGKVVGPILLNVANISILGGSVNQVLKTNGTGALSWTDQVVPGGGPAVLDDLTDVIVPTAQAGEVLKYDGANWINSAVPLNAFGTVTVGAVNITPDQLNDQLTFTASTGISLSADAGTDTITITNTAPNVAQNVFTTIAVTGQTSVVADNSTDTLTLAAGSNVTITTNDGTDTVTITATQPNSFTSIAVAGQNTIAADTVADTLTFTAGSGITITTNDGTDTVTISAAAGSGLEARSSAAGTTGSLADSTSADLNITGFKGYALYKIQTSVAAWVRLYTDGASRTADASRLELVDPDPGAGVIAEVITTGNQTILMSPAVIGFNNEATPTTTIPCRVTNKSGSTVAVTVTLTILKLEI